MAHALIFPVIQQFTEAFVQALQMPDGPTSDSGLKMEVLKVQILKYFLFSHEGSRVRVPSCVV